MFQITRPEWDILRVELVNGWNAETESSEMFQTLLAELDNSLESVTLLIVAGEKRPAYTDLQAAWAILLHDELKKIVVVAKDAQHAINHMGAARAERGLPPIPIAAYDTETEALAALVKA